MTTENRMDDVPRHHLGRRAIPRGLRWMLVGSLLAHAGLGLALAITSQAASETPDEEVITTKLVRLGKERPDDLLPRKTNPPPEPKQKPPQKPKADENKPEPNKPKPNKPKPNKPKQKKKSPPKPPQPPEKTSAAAAPQAKPDSNAAAERAEHGSELSSALDRLKKEYDTPEGSADGSAKGTALTSSLVANKYYNEIGLCLKNNYFIEGVSQSKLAGRQATVVVWIDADGNIIGHEIEKSSGLEAFDQATERAIQRCAQVSPPPKALRGALREEGVELVFKPD